MREIALFVEDHAHQHVIEALLKRIAGEYGIEISPQWHNATGGHARVIADIRLRLIRPPAARYPDRASRVGSRRRGGSDCRGRR